MSWLSYSRPRPARRMMMREEIKEYILNAIIDGSLRGGERIVETQLARHLGVSQSPVREALRELEQMGVVQTEPFRGVSVRSLTPRELREMYTVRATLEEMAVREAVPRLSPVTLDELQQMVSDMVRVAALGDAKQVVLLDVAFHRRIMALSGNGFLLRVWEMIQTASWTMVTARLFHDQLAYLAERHADVVAAIRTGDPALAGAALRRHIEEFAAKLDELEGPGGNRQE